MQLDALGKRYGLLPSQVLRQADTFDIYILDAALSYEHYYQQKQNNKQFVPDMTTDELLEIYNKGKANEDKVGDKK